MKKQLDDLQRERIYRKGLKISDNMNWREME